MSKLPELKKESRRRMALVVTDTRTCRNCGGNGITESGEDEYGSYYSVRCKYCFLGVIATRRTFDVRENKNGTFTVI